MCVVQNTGHTTVSATRVAMVSLILIVMDLFNQPEVTATKTLPLRRYADHVDVASTPCRSEQPA